MPTDLRPFLGTWSMEAMFPQSGPTGAVGRCGFAFILGGAFLEQRTTVDHPDAPDSIAIIAPAGDGFTQHYFDDRGVVRLYRMAFDGREWTLLRTEPDFSPLNVRQRFVGTFEDEGRLIRGRWETGCGDDGWQLDFELIYTKVA